MYKQLFAVSILMLLFVISPSAYAQEGAQDSTLNQTRGTTNTTGQVSGATDDRGGFNWMWLLPLLALPLLLLFTRGSKNEDRDQYRDQSLAGSKGGRTNGGRDQDDESY